MKVVGFSFPKASARLKIFETAARRVRDVSGESGRLLQQPPAKPPEPPYSLRRPHWETVGSVALVDRWIDCKLRYLYVPLFWVIKL
jgi:hypothetical protein